MSAKFTFHGAMCILIERSDGYKILVDPYIRGNPLAKVEVSEFFDVDLILVTHAAFDHYGDVIEIMENSNATLLCGNDVYRRVLKESSQISEDRLKKTIYGDERIFGATVIRTVQAHHISSSSFEGIWITAPPLGYVLSIEPGVVLYHPGDTSLFGDMRTIRDLYHPNIMVVGIDGIRENAPCELTPREAALAVSWVGASVVVPGHYRTGRPNLEQFKVHMASIAPDAELVIGAGKSFVFHPSHIEFS